jgi:ABC-type polar amino acid transport system ATPase subunit
MPPLHRGRRHGQGTRPGEPARGRAGIRGGPRGLRIGQDNLAEPDRRAGRADRRHRPAGRRRADHRVPGAGTRIRRHTVSFIFQSFNLFPGLTALANVQFGADVAGREPADRIARQVLDQVGLGGRGDHFAHQLSGGEQQRVAIARALATGNPILLADEPTGELDVRTGVQILDLLRAQADSGKTVVVVTHNREISRVADRVIELSSGHIVADGPPSGGRADLADLHW